MFGFHVKVRGARGRGAEAGRELRLEKRGKCKLESPPQQLIRDNYPGSESKRSE